MQEIVSYESVTSYMSANTVLIDVYTRNIEWLGHN